MLNTILATGEELDKTDIILPLWRSQLAGKTGTKQCYEL